MARYKRINLVCNEDEVAEMKTLAELLNSSVAYALRYGVRESIRNIKAAQQGVQPTGGTVAPANIDQRPEVNSADEDNQRPATSG